jgi:DNA-binding CsgD family transcriptional regulator
MSIQLIEKWLNKPAWADRSTLTGDTETLDEWEYIRSLLKHFQLQPDCQAEIARGLCMLTPRQRQILILMCQGYSQRLIAAQLKISPQTARSHTNMIYQRLGLSSRCELQAALLGLALSYRQSGGL